MSEAAPVTTNEEDYLSFSGPLWFLKMLRLPPIHPGVTVSSELEVRGLTAHRAAQIMCVPANRLGYIIAGERRITADTALRLAKLFGTSALFWMNLQSQYDLAAAERDHGSRISAEDEPA